MNSLIPLTSLQSLQYGKHYPRHSKGKVTIAVYWVISEERVRWVHTNYKFTYEGRMSCEDVRYKL